MKRLIYILIISICLFPNLIKAEECTNKDRTRLQKQADNVTYILEEYEEDGQTYFKATFSGVSKEIRIFNNGTLLSYYNLSDDFVNEIVVKRMIPGKKYIYDIYGSNNCFFTSLRKVTVNIPKINKFYNDEVCKGISDYLLCQKFNDLNLEYDEFLNKVNNYKARKNIKKDNETISNEKNENNFDFLKLYNKLYWPTFIGLICILILLIILWKKENKKNKL